MINIPEKKAEHVALAGIIGSLIFILLNLITASFCNAAASVVAGYQAIAMLLVWGISWLYLRAKRIADEEKQLVAEAEKIRKEQGRQQLFENNQIAEGVALTRFKEMDKWGSIIAGLFIITLQAVVGGFYLYSLLLNSKAFQLKNSLGLPFGNEELSNTAFASAVSFSIAFICFLFGKYASGMSRVKDFHILKAGSGFTILVACIHITMSASFLFGYYGYIEIDNIVAIVIAGLMIVISFEMLINLILDFYRPRIAGKVNRPVYESRIASLLAEPQGLLKTFSHTLDYQFGFEVSDTWFFKFLNKAIAPLILFQLTTLYLLTTIVVIEPGEVGIIERWGKPRGMEKLPSFRTSANGQKIIDDSAWDQLEKPLTAGYHLKLPWPIEIVKIVKRDLVRTLYIGSSQEEAKKKRFSSNLVTWDTEHLKGEFKYAMPVLSKSSISKIKNTNNKEKKNKILDVMFVSGSIDIHYVIGRLKDGVPGGEIVQGDVYRYLYRYSNPKKTLIALAESEVTKYMAGANFWDVIVKKVNATEIELKNNLQAEADKLGLGVRIVFVSLSNIHPPVGKVGKAYQAVVSSKQEKETKIYTAKAKAAVLKARTPGEIAEMLNKANSYYNSRTIVSKAIASRFNNQNKAYIAAPQVYLHRERMNAIEEGISKATNIILAPSTVTVVVDDKQDTAAAAINSAIGEETSKKY